MQRCLINVIVTMPCPGQCCSEREIFISDPGLSANWRVSKAWILPSVESFSDGRDNGYWRRWNRDFTSHKAAIITRLDTVPSVPLTRRLFVTSLYSDFNRQLMRYHLLFDCRVQDAAEKVGYSLWRLLIFHLCVKNYKQHFIIYTRTFGVR